MNLFKLKKPNKKKIDWTIGMSILSFCLILMIFIVDNLNEPLFELNLMILAPLMIITLILSLIVIVRIIRYWKVWPNGKARYLIICLALPAIIIYLDSLIQIFSV